MEWQPIETAPKEMWLLAYCPEGFDGFRVDPGTGKPEVCVGLMYKRRDGFWEGAIEQIGPPTHWMPLPEPPK